MILNGKKEVNKRKTHKKHSAIVSDSVGNYEKHPFFVRKVAAAKALLLKVGLPKELAKKTHA